MTNHAEQAKSIFMSALEKYSSEQWPAFLAGACRDDVALRERVEQLLQAHVDIGSIHTSAPPPTIDQLSPNFPVPRSVPTSCSSRLAKGAWASCTMPHNASPSAARWL